MNTRRAVKKLLRRQTPAGGGAGIVEALAGILERTDGVELTYETEAVRLSVAGDGRVDGVFVRGRDGLLRTLAAGAVVIASGGFEGSNEMLTQHLGGRAGDCTEAPSREARHD